MTRRLLAFARQQPAAARACEINEVVSASVAMLRAILPHDIAIEMDLEPDHKIACIDPAQLEDALLNLAINARDAMPAGGKLTFTTGAVSVDGDVTGAVATGDYVFITVSDTGSGMSRETQQRVFEPFFTTKGEGKGTGLGLSMVYGFARQAGGDVRLGSALGQGTRIEILLPRVIAGDVAAAGQGDGERSAS